MMLRRLCSLGPRQFRKAAVVRRMAGGGPTKEAHFLGWEPGTPYEGWVRFLPP